MKYFRFILKHTVLYYILCLLGLTVASGLSSFFLPEDVAGWINYLILLPLCLLAGSIPIYQLRRLDKLLAERNDPIQYLQQTDILLNGLDLPLILKRVNAGGNSCRALMLDRAVAFCNLGQYEDALSVYRFLQNNARHMPPVYMAMIFHNLAFIYAEYQNESLATYYFEQERLTWQSAKMIGKRGKSTVWFALTETEASLANKKGDFARAESLYRQIEVYVQGENHVSLYKKTALAFEVGEMYFRMGNYAEALPRLQFAAQNGGTCLYRAEAERLLSEIQAQQP